MNIIDYILIGIVFLYALIGFASGMLRQVCGLLCIILSLFAGYLFYKKTGYLLLLPVSIIAAAIICNIVMYICVIKRVRPGSRKEKPKISLSSRIGGVLIGGFKGTALALMVLICSYLFMGIFIRASPAISGQLEGSFFYSYLEQRNLLPGIRVAKNVYFASKLLSENLTVDLPENDEIIRKLKKNPSYRAVLKDRELQQSIQNKDYKRVLSDPEFLKLLKDKDFLNQIYSIDYEDIYKKQIEQEEW